MSQITSTYLPIVIENSYQYFDIPQNGFVWRNSENTFTGLAPAPENINVDNTIYWDASASQWVTAPANEAAGAFNYIQEQYSGVVFNDGSNFYSIDMSSDNNVNALQWNATDSRVELVEMNALHTIDLSQMVATTGYVIKTDGSGHYQVQSAPYLAAHTGDLGTIYTGVDATTGQAQFSAATPENLMGLTATGDNLVIASPGDSTWSSLAIPDATSQATNSSQFYHFTITKNDAGEVSYNYTAVVDATSVDGYNLPAALTADTVISAPTTLTTAVASFVSDVNYVIDATLDVYVEPITSLATSESAYAGKSLYTALPYITVTDTANNNNLLGKYVIKPNQTFQTVHVSKFFPNLSASPVLSIEVTIPTGPFSDKDIDVTYMKDSLMATCIPAGSETHEHNDEPQA